MTRTTCWIFSIYNEENNAYFWLNIELLRYRQQTFLVIDGGSSDKTLPNLEEKNIDALLLPKSTRGQRFDHGLDNCNTSNVVFVHPRTLLTEAIISRSEQLPPSSNWGAFTHSFDYSHPILRLTSWWSNYIRGDLRGIYYLDHILWAKMSLIRRAGGFPHDAIFEDTQLCLRLIAFDRPTRLPEKAITSALRFKKNGLAKQIFLNQIAKLKFYLNYDNSHINQGYERGLDLNGSTPLQGQQAPATEDPPADRS